MEEVRPEPFWLFLRKNKAKKRQNERIGAAPWAKVALLALRGKEEAAALGHSLM
jgi:hypothetical protein